MKTKNHLLKSHETILDFAFRKRVYATSGYSAIESGKVKPDVVGTSKVLLIDLWKYGAYKFQFKKNADKSALIKWYLSTGYKIIGCRETVNNI